MKNTLKITCALLTAVMLTACGGGGGDSSPQGSGSTKLSVANNTRYDFASAKVFRKSSASVMYDGAFVCSAGNVCDLLINQDDNNEPLLIAFSNKDGSIVSGYKKMLIPGNYAYISTSNVMLGVFLFDEFVRAKQQSDVNLIAQEMSRLFSNLHSPDGTEDFFEELGMYYNAKVLNGGQGLSQFYDQLLTQLNSDEILPANYPLASLSDRFYAWTADLAQQIKNTQIVSSAYAGLGLCPSSTTGYIEKINSVSKWIPIPGFSQIATVASKAASAACSSANQETTAMLKDISKTLNEMKSQLNLIDTKIDSLGFKMDEIGKKISKQAKADGIIQINEKYNELSIYINKYRSLMGNSANLEAAIKTAGGLTEKNYNRFRLWQDLLGNIEKQKNLFNELAEKERLITVADALFNLCSDENKIEGDIVATRINCALIANRISTQISYSQAAAGAMIQDEISLLKNTFASVKPGSSEDVWLKGNFYPNLFGADDWDSASESFKLTMRRSIDDLASAFANKGTEALKGFPYPALLDTIKSADCAVNNGDQSVVGISSWYKTSKPYVVTVCNNAGEAIRSVYNYDQNHTLLLNYLGVLVEGMAHGDCYVMEQKNYPNYVSYKYPVLTKENTLVPVGIEFGLMSSSEFKVNNNKLCRGTLPVILTPNASYDGNPVYNHPQYLNTWMKEVADAKSGDFSYYKFMMNGGQNTYPAPVRYTPKQQSSSAQSLSYLFLVSAGIFRVVNDWPEQAETSFTLQCVTGDCVTNRIDGSIKSPDGIRFSDGLTIGLARDTRQLGLVFNYIINGQQLKSP